MEKFRIRVKPSAELDIAKIKKSGDKATVKKLEKIILELSEHPKTGVDKPEQLKYNLSNLWSRKLNQKDKLIYEIIEEPDNLVVIISALGHYE